MPSRQVRVRASIHAVGALAVRPATTSRSCAGRVTSTMEVTHDPLLERAGAHEQRLIETKRGDRTDPGRVLDQRRAVGDHGVHHRVPVTTELGRDRGHRAASPDLDGHPPPSPIAAPRPRRRHLGLLLGEGPHLTRRRRATPPALVPHPERPKVAPPTMSSSSCRTLQSAWSLRLNPPRVHDCGLGRRL